MTPANRKTVRGEAASTSIRPEILAAQHPLHEKYEPYWDRLLDLSEGENLEKYIHRHARESAESHRFRRERVSYRNFCGPLLDLTCAYLFSRPITRTPTPKDVMPAKRDRPTLPHSGGYGGEVINIRQRREKKNKDTVQWDKTWQDFLYNVDQQGNSIDRFMRRVTYWTMCFGMVHVICDMPRVEKDEEPKTKADEKALDLNPYFSIYYPMDMVNWEVDEHNRYIWVRFREPVTGAVDPWNPLTGGQNDPRRAGLAMKAPLGTSRARGERGVSHIRPEPGIYRTFTREGWELHEVKENEVKELGKGDYPDSLKGHVPVITFFNRQRARHPVIGLSQIHDISGLNQEILNTDSLIVEATYQQVLNILVMKRQPVAGGDIVIGPENVLEYSGDSPPFFITPSTAPLQFMEARIQGLVQEIYRLARHNRGDALQVRAVPSGVAATVEFNETDRMLAEKAEEIQNAEWELHYLWFRWKGGIFDGTIDYPDSFQVRPFQEELQLVTAAGTAVRSDKFRRELEKRVVRRMLPNVPEGTIAQIEFEIDIIPPMISTFSGPIWFDPVTQEVKQPMQDTNPIGLLAEILRDVEAKQGEPVVPDPRRKPTPEEEAKQAEQAEMESQQIIAKGMQRDPRQRIAAKGKNPPQAKPPPGGKVQPPVKKAKGARK